MASATRSAFSPEQESQLDERFNSINAAITASNANMANAVADLARQIGRLSDRLDRQQQTSSPVLPSIEPSPLPQASADPAASTAPAAPAAPTGPPPPAEWHPYKRMLKAEDVGYFDPGFQASEQEHGKSTPGPVVNAGKHAYYLDIFVFVDRLNELSRKYGPHAVQDVIPSCLRGSALTWWTTEVDHSTKTTLEASTAELQPWIDLLIKAFRTDPAQALAAFTASRYTLRDLHMAMTPKTWIHGQLSLVRSADLGSTYNQLTMIWNQMQRSYRTQVFLWSLSPNLRVFVICMAMDILLGNGMRDG